MNLSAHFTLRELTRSEYAERHGLDNTPSAEVVENLRAWCLAIGEPVRLAMGKPISVSSGYRAPQVNKAIGGNTAGQHPRGEAVDFEIMGMSNLHLAQKIIDMKLPFDQLILEFHDDAEPNSGWVHVSYKRAGGNRGQVLRARHVNGKTVYTSGLA